MMTQKAIYV